MSYSNVTEVWAEFSNITKIGRPSKKEGKIREYLINWAKEHGLESETDEAGNVIIRKKAAEGQSGRAPIALQAHMDMVCEKDKGVSHDWENDPIKTKVEGEWLTAEGTTLGADDGIGMAMALAILKSDTVRNSELECLFTVDEETGLYGATNIKEGWLKAKTLINLDSEEEGEFCPPCEGLVDIAFGQQERYHQHEQHDVLPESRPVAQFDGVAEAAAVGYGVLQRDIERERSHHQHKQQRQPRSDVRAHIAEQTEAQRKLKDYHHNSRRHSQRQHIHEDPSEGFQIVFYLIGSTQRVNGFHKA